MRRFLLSSFLSLAACALAFAGQTIELKLKNGDKITGEFVRREWGKIVIKHPVLGELSIPESEIAPAVGPAAAAITLPPNAPSPILPFKRKTLVGSILSDTTGTLEFGLQDQSGRVNSKSTSLRADAEYKHDTNSYKFDWKYYISYYDDVLQSDKKEWDFRWRHDLSKRFFTQTVTSYSNDRVKQINDNWEQSAGVGWAVLNTHRQKFNVGSGLVTQYRRILDQHEETSVLGEIFEDYSRKINNRISISQELDARYSPVNRVAYTTVNNQLVAADDSAQNYKFKYSMAVTGKITDKLSLNFRYDFEFDNTIADQSLRSDRRISTTLGYSF